MARSRDLASIAAALCAAGIVFAAESALAATHLYTGSVRIALSYSPSSSYSVPFGSSLQYPHMNNLPSGDIANVSGTAPAAIGLGANQITLQTSFESSSLPSSWGTSVAATSFSGGHAEGNFFAGGGPGAASSGPASGMPASQFGVTFKGTPERFGGTMALLGSSRVRWGAVSSPYSYRCDGCTILTRPLAPIGGAFGGMASEGTWINGTGAHPTQFDVTLWGFPWTTGTVTARAPAPFAPNTVHSVTAKGSDQRTPNGEGNIQLVSPFVVRYSVQRTTGTPGFVFQPGVAIANLHFVPEPAAMLMFAAGVVVLAGLAALSRRVD
jgi:hypothetical protein